MGDQPDLLAALQASIDRHRAERESREALICAPQPAGPPEQERCEHDGKVVYRSRGQARSVLRHMQSVRQDGEDRLTAYQCPKAPAVWHLGHVRERHRKVS